MNGFGTRGRQPKAAHRDPDVAGSGKGPTVSNKASQTRWDKQEPGWWLIRLSLESERSKRESRHIEGPELATGRPNIVEARLRSEVQSRRAMFMRPIISTLQESCLVKGTRSLVGRLSLESECS